MRKLKKAWLQSFEDYTTQSESPVSFNTWTGIGVLGSTLKRNVFIRSWPYDIYPNQYIVLVGPPGVGKGVAINPAVDLAQKAGTVNYVGDRTTAERIIELIANGFSKSIKTPQGALVTTQDHCATIRVSELQIFINASNWMLPLLCEMWDKSEFSYETKTKGCYTIKEACTSFLAACVPEYINKLSSDRTESTSGGFASRCIFVYASKKSKLIAWPSSNSHLQQLGDDLVTDLQDIGTVTGEFTFTQDARALFENWYLHAKQDPYESPALKGFKNRMKSHILKTSMILSISENNNLIITRQNLFNAMSLIDQIKDTVDVTFGSVGESSLAIAQEKVRDFIVDRGMASRQEIMRHLYKDVTDEDLGKILHILTIAGKISNGNVIGKIEYYKDISGAKKKP